MRACIASALLVVTACHGAGSKADGPRASEAALAAAHADDLRESARGLLEANCGQCHTRGSPDALPRALAVYDLDDEDWSRHMTGDQLRDAEGRLHQADAPTRGEDEVRPIRTTPEQLALFHAYVERETSRLAAAAPSAR